MQERSPHSKVIPPQPTQKKSKKTHKAQSQQKPDGQIINQVNIAAVISISSVCEGVCLLIAGLQRSARPLCTAPCVIGVDMSLNGYKGMLEHVLSF